METRLARIAIIENIESVIEDSHVSNIIYGKYMDVEIIKNLSKTLLYSGFNFIVEFEEGK